MNKILILVIVMSLVCGCATVQTLPYHQINFDDGIDEREAIAIAKDFVLNNSDLEGVKENSGKIHFEDKEGWYVRMYLNTNNQYGKLGQGLLAYLVVIDKQAGKVLRHNYDK